MKIEYSIPIDWLTGNFSQQFYCRRYRGKPIIQRRPNRSDHVPSQTELENRKQFAAQYAGKHEKIKNQLTPPTAGE